MGNKDVSRVYPTPHTHPLEFIHLYNLSNYCGCWASSVCFATEIAVLGSLHAFLRTRRVLKRNWHTLLLFLKHCFRLLLTASMMNGVLMQHKGIKVDDGCLDCLEYLVWSVIFLNGTDTELHLSAQCCQWSACLAIEVQQHLGWNRHWGTLLNAPHRDCKYLYDRNWTTHITVHMNKVYFQNAILSILTCWMGYHQLSLSLQDFITQ